MVKKIGDNKIGRVDASDVASEVKSAGTVQGVDPVRPTGAVERTNSVGGVNKRRATRVMTLAEREELFKLVSEEPERMFPEDTLPAQKRKLIEGAVKMAIDSALEEADENGHPTSSDPKRKL